ncbi:MAG TPA: lyase family protein, partial [Acidimicrobiales bacterium]|nr:lyase family protein [Acidimicrobiales bacterium]
MATDEVRVERDTMGEVEVPAAAKWGAQTQRAVENFPVSGRPVERALVHALGAVKAAAAEVNGELGVLDADVASAIAAAAEEVADGRWDDQFPVDTFQTGSGTSTNMNANEVIAHLAGERLGRPVHPNDEVNASQSSNDVFPTAIHLAAAVAARRDLLPALDHLAGVLDEQAQANAHVVKAGRTHLMDATPVTLGQELGGYATQVSQAAERIAAAVERVGEVPLGGTATGTGLNAPPGFARAATALLSERLGVVVH